MNRWTAAVVLVFTTLTSLGRAAPAPVVPAEEPTVTAVAIGARANGMATYLIDKTTRTYTYTYYDDYTGYYTYRDPYTTMTVGYGGITITGTNTYNYPTNTNYPPAGVTTYEDGGTNSLYDEYGIITATDLTYNAGPMVPKIAIINGRTYSYSWYLAYTGYYYLTDIYGSTRRIYDGNSYKYTPAYPTGTQRAATTTDEEPTPTFTAEPETTADDTSTPTLTTEAPTTEETTSTTSTDETTSTTSTDETTSTTSTDETTSTTSTEETTSSTDETTTSRSTTTTSSRPIGTALGSLDTTFSPPATSRRANNTLTDFTYLEPETLATVDVSFPSSAGGGDSQSTSEASQGPVSGANGVALNLMMVLVSMLSFVF